jgi:signal transduction histidine kinase
MDINTTKPNKNLRGAFFDTAYSPFVILDKDLFFIDINQAAAAFLKTNNKAIVGKHLLKVFPHLAGTEYYQSCAEVIKTGVSAGFDQVAFHTDKGVFKFILKIFKIGEGVGITTLDITHITSAIDKLKVTQVNLQKVNKNLEKKNRELEELSYITAHDLKAPLANLHSLLELLVAENAIADSGMYLFEKVEFVTKAMTDKLNALSKVIALKSDLVNSKEVLSFSTVVDKIKALHAQEIIKSRVIIKEDYSKCDRIRYNPIQFESVLHNLISNAIKYRHAKRKPQISIKTAVIKDKIVLTIKDNGIGFDGTIDPNKIFGLFKRMHTHVEGLGVGLYMTNTIINNNGGKIKVSSEINKGTEFKIYF